MEYRDYPYQSVLGPYIRDYIAEKRALGFIYNGKAYQMYRFDQYWLSEGFDDVFITREKVNKWICAFPNESKSSQEGRINAVKSIAIYLSLHGKPCYIPIETVGSDHPVIHLMDRSELHQFFMAVDSYAPHTINQADYRMADEYPIMFRLYYCCGMRNDEVCSLKTADVDFKEGIVSIRGGKNQKDRLVYLPEDLRVLISAYYATLKAHLGFDPVWLFPGRIPSKHIPKTSIDRKFREFWNKTESSSHCDRTPTPHSLRHGFVVDRLNSWILSGMDINVMFVYLSRYLGHNDPDESFYYYHLVNDAYRILRQKDTVSADVIPEVRRR